MTLCAAVYLPGLASIPPVDRDEARFMQATRQMLESGDFIRPRFQSEDRFKKPVGIYWLQSLSVWLTGNGDLGRVWPYRLPSAAAAAAAVLLTYHFGARWYARRVALAAAALLAASLLLIVAAHLATTDATLLALIVAAQGCLGVLYLAAHRTRLAPGRYALGFWLAQGLAILIKGPVAPLISGLTVAALLSTGGATARNLRPNLRWRWGLPLMLLVTLPWVVAIARETGGAFLQQWWLGDVWPKLAGGHESHGAPPGTHLLLLPATFWPGSLALLPAVAFVRRRQRPVERFCLAWLVPAWLVFELVPNKLPHYILPLLPPLALLCARAVLARRISTSARWRRAIPVAAAATIVLCIALLMLLPNLSALWLSRSATQAISAQRRTTADTPLAAASYHEPSLVFLTGGRIQLVEPEGLATFLHEHPTGLGVITADARARFDRAAARLGVRAEVVWEGAGINYSKGKRTRLLLLARERTREVVGGGHAAPVDHQALVAR